MPTMSVIEAIRDALQLEMARDERVVVLGQDVGALGGVFRASQGLFERFGERRVVDMPLSEGMIVSSALGLALSGLVPVAEVQFMGFTRQAFHQLTVQAARYRFRSRGRFTASLTIRSPFGGGARMPDLHADAIEAQHANAPGLKVVMPACPYDAKGMLLSAIRDPDPVLFCEPLRGYRGWREEVPEGDYTVPFGQARTVREGSDITLVAWSAAVHLAERAADRLAEEGVRCTVLDLRTLVPLDVEGLVRAVSATGRCLVVHEAPLTAGFGAEVVATIQEEAFYSLDAPIARVAAPDTPYPPGTLEDTFLPNEERVCRAARSILAA
ncbi:MAG TPA: alpha-ketoacid dehydrogenase subunit beta [Candidatus Dormibacteraeota bacterium]|jgi:pyruvate dehydrogenase E1 component beta subunit|nr:alpha-ketoacid dehydrogenase subunit beta [Candidatus Dormibacteraeota bacterium]